MWSRTYAAAEPLGRCYHGDDAGPDCVLDRDAEEKRECRDDEDASAHSDEGPDQPRYDRHEEHQDDELEDACHAGWRVTANLSN